MIFYPCANWWLNCVTCFYKKIKERKNREKKIVDEKMERGHVYVRWFVTWLILVVNAKKGS